MRNERDVFKAVAGYTARQAQRGGDGAAWGIVALMFLFSSEFAKVMLRRNFGKYGLYVPPLVIAITSLLAISLLSFNHYFNDDFSESVTMHLSTGIFYLLLALYGTYQAITKYNLAQQTDKAETNYQGDSYMLSFLEWGEARTRYILDPVMLIAIGTFYCFFDPLGGFPLIWLGVSIWIRYVIEFWVLRHQTIEHLNEHRPSTDPNNDEVNRFNNFVNLN